MKGKSAEGAVILQDRFWVQDEESCDCHPGGWRATRRYVSAVTMGLYGRAETFTSALLFSLVRGRKTVREYVHFVYHAHLLVVNKTVKKGEDKHGCF